MFKLLLLISVFTFQCEILFAKNSTFNFYSLEFKRARDTTIKGLGQIDNVVYDSLSTDSVSLIKINKFEKIAEITGKISVVNIIILSLAFFFQSIIGVQLLIAVLFTGFIVSLICTFLGFYTLKKIAKRKRKMALISLILGGFTFLGILTYAIAIYLLYLIFAAIFL
jgi:hypothetical protein